MIETKNLKESFFLVLSRSSEGVPSESLTMQKTHEAQEAIEAEGGKDEAAEQDPEDVLEDEPEEAELHDSEMEELKDDLGGNYNLF